MKFLLIAPYGTLYLSPHPAGSLATDPIPSIQSTPIIANSDLRWYSLSELLHWVHVLQFKTKKNQPEYDDDDDDYAYYSDDDSNLFQGRSPHQQTEPQGAQ